MRGSSHSGLLSVPQSHSSLVSADVWNPVADPVRDQAGDLHDTETQHPVVDVEQNLGAGFRAASNTALRNRGTRPPPRCQQSRTAG